MKMLIPVLLALVGLAGGVAAGHFLKPPAENAHGAMAAPAASAPDPMIRTDGDVPAHSIPAAADHDPEEAAKYEYITLDKQFIVPLVTESRVQAMIVLSLSLEATPEAVDVVRQREPKLRDVFLQVLFRHAQSGGFNGVFTGGQVMSDLRAGLRDAARGVIGDALNDVLVTDIVRQDM
jgi:flagellar basal body-associated protein FliL